MRATSKRFPFWTNWNRNLVFRPEQLVRPQSSTEVAAIVAAARNEQRTVRPVGSGYSYTPLVQSDHVMLSLERMSGVGRVDLHAGTAVVGAGTTLRTLTHELARRGAAIANLGDIDGQTVAGAIATGTHGTGIDIGCLSSQVLGMTLVDGTGRIHEWSDPADATLNAARVGLGALGVVTSVTLAVEPLYDLVIERGSAEFSHVLRDLGASVGGNRNFEFFWFPQHGLTYTKKMNKSPQRSGGFKPVDRALRFANDMVVENGIVWIASESVRRWPGGRQSWLDFARKIVPTETAIVPAHRAYATPRLVRHYEVEYAIPYQHAADVLGRLDAMLAAHPMKTLFPVEVRFTKADDIPLSMSSGRTVLYVAVHTYRREDYRELFDRCEELFLQFDGRPHWGKLHTLRAADLRQRYPQWDRFQAVRDQLDPDGVFLNGYLRRVLVGRAGLTALY